MDRFKENVDDTKVYYNLGSYRNSVFICNSLTYILREVEKRHSIVKYESQRKNMNTPNRNVWRKPK